MDARMERRINARLVALLCLGSLTSACSLVKLSDNAVQAHCGGNAECDVLNDRSAADFNPCTVWQCVPTTKYCELGPLDADHDGYSPSKASSNGKDFVCQSDPAKQDCDDAQPASFPGKAEICDGLDNNCDGNIDEGQLQRTSSVLASFADLNAGGASDVSVAVDPDSHTLALGYSISRTLSNVPGVTVVTNGLAAGAPTSEVRLPPSDQRALLADGVGVGALGAESFALAFYQKSGAHRLLAGTFTAVSDPTAPVILQASDRILTYGLHCTASEACADNASSPAAAIAAPATGTPALSARGSDVLVSYVRNPSGEGAPDHCAKTDTFAPKAVLANLLTKSSGSGLDEVSAQALALGQTWSLSAPALLAIPKLTMGGQSSDFGWLAVFADSDGKLVAQRVVRQGDTLTATPLSVSLGTNGNARYQDVHLVLGPSSDTTGQVVGVVYQVGCSTDGEIGFSLLGITLTTSGEPQVDTLNAETLVAGGTTESNPALTYSNPDWAAPAWVTKPTAGYWGVVYRDPKGLRARVLDGKGKPLGDDSYVLLPRVASGADMLNVFHAPAIVPLAAQPGWFGAVTYADSGSGHVFESTTLSSCQSAH